MGLCERAIQLHDVRHVKTFKTTDEQSYEAWYYGRTKVTKKDLVIKISIHRDTESIEVFAAGNDPSDITGLLAEIGRNLARQFEGFGRVQPVFNIHIKDSVIQRSNLLSFCEIDGTCGGDVVIEDAYVQRSNIAAGNVVRLRDGGDEAEQRAREEAERKKREEQEKLRKAGEEQIRMKEKEERERNQREEGEKKKRERKAREEREKKAREESERKERENVRQEEERLQRKEEERKAREEAEKRKKHEEERPIREGRLRKKDIWENSKEIINIKTVQYEKSGFLGFAKKEKEVENRVEIRRNFIGMEFVLIPAGEFMRGSEEYDAEKPVHRVKIGKTFYLGTCPVTQREWKAIMGDKPSHFKGDDLPVEQVSWNDVQEFIRKLNEKEGTDKYRLPFETEWEYAALFRNLVIANFPISSPNIFISVAYSQKPQNKRFSRNECISVAIYDCSALTIKKILKVVLHSITRKSNSAEYACRAGTTNRYSFGDSKSELGDYAWYDENSDRETHLVGKKKPNPYGLYDMHGNVWEWTQDRWHSNYNGAPTDGSAWEHGEDYNRVIRGGSWRNTAGDCRHSIRIDVPGIRRYAIGFRLLKEL